AAGERGLAPPRRFRPASLLETVLRRPRDGQPGAEIVEESQALHQRGVHLALSRRVALAQLAHGGHELSGHATPFRIGTEDVGGDEAQDVAELLEGRVAVRAHVEARDGPYVD